MDNWNSGAIVPELSEDHYTQRIRQLEAERDQALSVLRELVGALANVGQSEYLKFDYRADDEQLRQATEKARRLTEGRGQEGRGRGY